MRVLIATNELQGTAPGDYSHTVEGELVTPVVDIECNSPDRCGCGRGFPGLASARATTTAMVVEREFITAADLREAVLEWLERDGWCDLLRDQGDDDAIDEIVDEHVEIIDEVCRSFPVGTVLERRGTVVSARRHTAAA